MTRHISIAVALFLVLCASWVIAQNRSGNPKHGQTVYEQLCLRCHGQKLDGRGQEAKFLTVPPADLQSLSSRTKSDWELLIVIAHGVMYSPMHGFRDVLSEQDIRDVFSYIRMEAPFKPVA